MHFLEQIIRTPQLEEPAKNHINIHRHFYRYSRGKFSGPALKIVQTSSKITLKGSFDYEDLIQELVVSSIPAESIKITGVLYTGQDINPLLKELGLNWTLKKSTGKAENYKAEISDELEKQKLLEIIEALRVHGYLLLSFKHDTNHRATTKKRLPQPSRKQPMEENVNSKVDFCTGVLANTKESMEIIIKAALSDFASDLPEKWKTILLSNNYSITEIEIPKNVKDSKLLRIMAIRKGILERILEVDGTTLEKQYSIIV
ncbi:MAG: hypothetical protein ACTSYC_07185 [Promethearchaeota archaeon]